MNRKTLHGALEVELRKSPQLFIPGSRDLTRIVQVVGSRAWSETSAAKVSVESLSEVGRVGAKTSKVEYETSMACSNRESYK